MTTRDLRLVRTMRRQGIVYPRITLREARRAGLPLSLACALLQKESGGGKNEFGHDPTSSIPEAWMGKTVTRIRYLYYKRNRQRGAGMQGVGPCQLTWWATQDRADALGGCWKPGPNMRVGFSALRALIRAHGIQSGAAAYNGSGPAAVKYGEDFLAKARAWHKVLA